MSHESHVRELLAIAATDRTFAPWERDGRIVWRGKCLICNGFLEFTADGSETREVTVEHILARANGGAAHDLANLGLVHPRCNNEKGRTADKAGPGDPTHDAVVEGLLRKRRQRWRDPQPE